MKNSKLLDVLQSFSNSELLRMCHHLESGDKHKPKAVQLWYLVALSIRYSELDKSREEYWEEIYPGQDFDPVRFRKLCSEAVQHLERYLSVEAYFNDHLLEASVRLKALSKESLESIHRTHFARMENLLDKYPERGTEYYFYRYEMEKNAYSFRQSNLQRFKITNIDTILDNLDIFYIIEKLKYHCEGLSRKTFLKHEYQNRLIREILEMIQAGEYQNVPLIQIYYQIILAHKEPDNENHYFQLKNLLSQFSLQLPRETLKEVYTSALNYCNRKINQGKNDFIQEAFEMYRTLLNKELLFERDQLSHWTLKNMVILALRLGEYQWAEKFIDEIKHRIPEKFRQNAITYNQAQVFFYKREYERVILLLQEVEYEDVTYNLGAKAMLLATYFELEEWDALFALSESFKVYIHRKKNLIPEARRMSYLNLIKFTIRMYKAGLSGPQKVEKLLNELNQTRQEIASINWIREKLESKILVPAI